MIFQAVFVVLLVGASQAARSRRDYSQNSCGCNNGMCTISFPMPKRAKIINNCQNTDRLERRFSHLTAMVHALHDEMVSLANKVQKQDTLITKFTGSNDKKDNELVETMKRIQQRQEWEDRVEQAGLVCPLEFDQEGSMCYLLMEEMFNWTYAGQLCKERGASLVTIESDRQQKHVANMLKKYFIEEHVWTGANSINHPASFVWNSESDPSEYYNWAPGMPVIKDNLQCVYMSSNHDWQWKVGPCDKEYYFLCSKPSTRN